MKVKSKVVLAGYHGVIAPWLTGKVEINNDGLLLIRFDREENSLMDVHPNTVFPIRHYARKEDVIVLEE